MDLFSQNKKCTTLLLSIAALVCFLALLPFSKAAGESKPFPSNIRVGMLQQKQEVSFSTEGKYQLVNLSTGKIISDIKPKEKWTAFAANNLIKLMKNGVQIGVFSGPVVAQETKYSIAVSGSGAVENKSSAKGLAVQGAEQNVKMNEDFSQYQVQTSDGLLSVKASESLNLITLQNGVSKQRLRGSLELRSTKEGLTVINELPLEKYLCGVVQSEMPASWPTEALKAQAVAARCYVLGQMGSSTVQGFDVTADQNSQAYRGYEGETKVTNLVVQQTAGLVAVYNNKPINAYFHSSSGGFTENSEDIWKDKIPYIRGKADPYDKNTKHYGWQVKFTQKELLQQLDKQGIKNWKEVTDIEILSLTSSGKRVQKIKLIGLDQAENTVIKELSNPNTVTEEPSRANTVTKELSKSNTVFKKSSSQNTVTKELPSVDKTVTKEISNANNVRTTFGLKSANFEMTKEFDTDKRLKQVSFTGSGWGHGLGMSQYGAAEMARQGYTFKDILQYYYTGIDIKPNYGQ